RSSTCGPGPTRPKPTERPSASFRPACANGPTPQPTKLRKTAPLNCRAGFTATTGIAPCQYRSKAPDQPTRLNPGQRVEAPQLCRLSERKEDRDAAVTNEA